MPAKKRPTAIQTRQGHPEGISDILGTAGQVAKYYGKKAINANSSPSKIAKNALKGANYVNPLNPKGLGKDIRNNFFAGKEIERVGRGKGSKKDAAIIAGTAASWLFPYAKVAKLGKGIQVAEDASRAAKLAAGAARGAVKVTGTAAGWGGADYVANKTTMAALNKVKPNKKATVTAKPKTKKGK